MVLSKSKEISSKRSLFILDENLKPVLVNESVINMDCRYDFNESSNFPSKIDPEEKCIFKLSKGSELKTLETVSGIIFKGSIRIEKDSIDQKLKLQYKL